MIRFEEVNFLQHVEKAWPLFVEHREELTTNKELMKLAPDFPTYEALQAAGALLSIAAFDVDEIVGYSINVLARNLHYADVFMCQNDVLFFTPAHRRGRTGLKLIAETERMARERGCHIVLWHAKPNTSLDQILRRKNYKTQDIVYTKVL